MNENFLQFIWKNCLFRDKFGLVSTGDEIEIIHTGEHNTDSGPDFANARIRIANTLWVGSVEIHLSSSDWFRHRHHEDPAYGNVILHVVLNHDREVFHHDGQTIPTLVLDFDPSLLNRYKALMNNQKWIACEDFIREIDPLIVEVWLNRMLLERLDRKAGDISEALSQQQNDWDEVFYQKLARSFGYKVNAEPFEQLARKCPWKLIAKHRDNLLQMEALLFGQAGFLGSGLNGDYAQALMREYVFLKQKYGLEPIHNHLWKHLRLRPVNFPAQRIAQFAAFLHKTEPRVDYFISLTRLDQVQHLLTVLPSDYWQKHYSFGIPSSRDLQGLGEDMCDIIIMNVLVPFMYLYGQWKNRREIRDMVFDWLGKLKAENNSTVRHWQSRGIAVETAFVSQALLQLKNEYCYYRRCLHCQIGKQIITLEHA